MSRGSICFRLLTFWKLCVFTHLKLSRLSASLSWIDAFIVTHGCFLIMTSSICNEEDVLACWQAVFKEGNPHEVDRVWLTADDVSLQFIANSIPYLNP